MVSKVAKEADTVPQYFVDGRSDNETVQYTGTAVVMKKLKVLGSDAAADAEDDASEFDGKNVSVQLLSSEIDPETGKTLVSSASIFERWDESSNIATDNLKFKVQFSVPRKFGLPCAILVDNNHPNEFQLLSFSLDLPDSKKEAHFWANSWVANTGNSDGRCFFLNKAYLPSETPATLREYREKELLELRGNGKGTRKLGERIYDYDVYNDLGNPDKDLTLTRRTLGGSADFPFPRRLRTGRAPTAACPEFESPDELNGYYVPRDESIDPIKTRDHGANVARAGKHAQAAAGAIPLRGESFENIESIKRAFGTEGAPRGSLYPLPQVLQGDSTAWQTDAEFAREFLAGLNPLEIKLVKEFPIKSKLSSAQHGDPLSAISAKHVEGQLDGLTIEQALSQKKLFVVDYHDVFLPLVERINAQPGMRAYASRTLLFLSGEETLKVLSIELVLPGSGGSPKNARVFTPPADTSKTDYVWELAKAHVMSNEMAVHQVTSHFGRSHAMTEPVIIATNRQLSKLHPIHQLMLPHFRLTLEINAIARKTLINAGGMFEGIFTPGAYLMELVVSYYKDVWNFESQALPIDLLNRGMAVPDKKAKEGVKLLVNDYPYAADGLELWSAMKTWNKDYIDVYYKDDNAVQTDTELQSWWSEFRNVAHSDMKDAPGWPTPRSKKDLTQIVTIMQWLCSCQHAAINFSQFDYAAFMPQRPTRTRRLIPNEGTPEWEEFQSNPERFFLSAVSDAASMLSIMSVFEITSNHATNEEYIGDRAPGWTQNEKVEAAFERYKSRLAEIDELIQARNRDPKLKNRSGEAGQLPYELLRPSSGPGVTAMGIPNSITV